MRRKEKGCDGRCQCLCGWFWADLHRSVVHKCEKLLPHQRACQAMHVTVACVPTLLVHELLSERCSPAMHPSLAPPCCNCSVSTCAPSHPQPTTL